MDINDFITQLEIVLECEGQGYIQCLEKAKMIKEKMLELKEESIKIERAVKSSTGNALDLCLPIWFGEDEDED